MDEIANRDAYTRSERTKLRLKRDRGAYDKAVVHDILDASILCHVGTVVDGEPYVTPTAFWREGDHIYWHGSAASRALKAQAQGMRVCVTVAHLDGLVIARSGMHSSINYRSVMMFGTATVVSDPDHKRRAMDIFVSRFMPGRARSNRPPTATELKGTTLMTMHLDEVSAKVRTGDPGDDREDYALPIWAGVVDIATVVEGIRPDPLNMEGVAMPESLAAYRPGRPVGDVMREIYDADADAAADASDT